jgi:two-component system, chemotaxis family, protein-glutamate methylesterase/glutaminase
MTFARDASGKVRVHLDRRPSDTPHRPSVDVLFKSASDVYGARVLGVVMTGMGSDGLRGAAWIKAAGGRVLTQDESSCVVYGMPRSVAEAALSDQSVPLDRLHLEIARSVAGGTHG